MMDNHDPKESVKNNEALCMLAQQLKPIEAKLSSIIQKSSSEEELEAALKLNDDLRSVCNSTDY